ncbi:MAG: hydrolase 2, exosortase A system-associated [Halofilum sp. (in: g-proteobacteria)]|nr:hydrolase 2, exosortase A system-associated [Halofilum sp. (in: g-proteobacteria)]
MLDPVFLDGTRGRVLCTFFNPGPGNRTGDGLLLLPPFAEEMNKSRRMMARLGHALAERGWVTALVDPFGTGDSEGDFGEADWDTWRADAGTAAGALLERGVERLALCGLRTGALLALDGCRDLPLVPARLMLWQPVTNGRQFLTRFLRLRLAASMSGGERESTADLRARLEAGESLEIAGYELAPALARALDSLDAQALRPPEGVAVDWLEVSGAEPPKLSAASERVIDAWRTDGFAVQSEAVAGDAFWATQEIVDVPELIDRSLARLASP